ncbi:hypothetical protein SAMN05421847_0007 [Halpernia humi]|uniref:Uncharacterized protein n=1 Tax=Halpernia humi TaxID=493375 RepID=A0A1H5S273_9FLAO|nr:hypothetical protein SAMN05421847_0007 [Halpernia humi]
MINNTDKKIARSKVGFDAIKTMREIRDKISIEIMNMTYEQERAYLDKLLAKPQTKSK